MQVLRPGWFNILIILLIPANKSTIVSTIVVRTVVLGNFRQDSDGSRIGGVRQRSSCSPRSSFAVFQPRMRVDVLLEAV